PRAHGPPGGDRPRVAGRLDRGGPGARGAALDDPSPDQAMNPISRGFRGRRETGTDSARIPPGQYLTPDFPVLSAGPTPHTAPEAWSFTIQGAIDEPVSWTWDEFQSLPSDDVTVDIHCVTKWSKLDTMWTGVSIDTLLADVDTSAPYVLA